jgi:hypothetical protein
MQDRLSLSVSVFAITAFAQIVPLWTFWLGESVYLVVPRLFQGIRRSQLQKQLDDCKEISQRAKLSAEVSCARGGCSHDSTLACRSDRRIGPRQWHLAGPPRTSRPARRFHVCRNCGDCARSLDWDDDLPRNRHGRAGNAGLTRPLTACLSDVDDASMQGWSGLGINLAQFTQQLLPQ